MYNVALNQNALHLYIVCVCVCVCEEHIGFV